VHTLDLGGEQETLGPTAKKEDGGVRWLAGVQQVEMNQRLGRRGVFLQRVLPFTTGNGEKPFYPVLRDVGESGGGAGGGVTVDSRGAFCSSPFFQVSRPPRRSPLASTPAIGRI